MECKIIMKIFIISLLACFVLSITFIKKSFIMRFLIIFFFLIICFLYGQLCITWGYTVATLDYSRAFSEIMNALYNSSKTNNIIVLQKQILYLNENFPKYTSENESYQNIILDMEELNSNQTLKNVEE